MIKYRCIHQNKFWNHLGLNWVNDVPDDYVTMTMSNAWLDNVFHNSDAIYLRPAKINVESLKYDPSWTTGYFAPMREKMSFRSFLDNVSSSI